MLIFGQFTTGEAGLASCLFFIYIFCLFTVAPMTFRKGYTWLGVLGIFFPVLWLVGATLKPKPGSYVQDHQAMAERSHMKEYTD